MNDIYLPRNQPDIKSRRLKQAAAILIPLIFLGILLSWLNSHSFINIRVNTPLTEEFSYVLVDQETKKSTVINSKSPTLKKLVKKGTYEVLVSSRETSYFSVVSTKPFLKTTEIKSNLQQEKSRAFVGNNPGPCMHYGQNLLFTYACGADYDSLAVHSPASADTPTTTLTPPSVLPEVAIGGTVNLAGKDLILLSNVVGGESEQSHSLYDLTPDLRLIHHAALLGLEPAKSYNVSQRGQGFLAYDSSFQDIISYDANAASPQKIDIDRPDNEELAGQQISTDGELIAVAYSDPNRVLDSVDEAAIQNTEKTAVQVYASGQTKSFLFDGSYYLAQLCAAKYLCLVQDRELVVYDIGGKEAKPVVRIGNVYNIKTVGDKLLVVRYDGVLEFDIASRSGSMQYSYGAYSPCGVETAQNPGYVLCLTNPRKDKVAIYIDPSQDNVDSIDKKLLALLDQPYISAISAYRSFIYISPELGEPEYDEPSKGFAPNPEIKQKTTQDINKIIKELGINPSLYSIINTQP